MLIRNRIARAVAAGTLVLAAPVLTSCGFNFATDKVYTPAAGANNRDASVDVLNAVIVATENGEGTLVTTLVNNETDADKADSLESATGTTANDSEVTVDLSKPVEIPARGYARLATATEENGLGEKPPADGYAVYEPGIEVTGDFAIGEFVKLTLTFENAGDVEVEVPVVANNCDWAGQDGDEAASHAACEGQHENETASH
ncbi:hypothetical protein ncot_02920 [Nocardioides sp. JQ2195]|uniref:hypothetical protein n=1 Tax=Nocardioides sp. JQ2195 TaxID=2592334 RepID=UPI00143ED692|nr:hypothetical protein [Nocardioides sp. JQ2195]QIX25657.1 hypothetical protein ncot_02920 [Nocardioides sp. JQ2195]